MKHCHTNYKKKYHFDGVACTDWNIMFDNNAVENFGGMCWGVENVPEVVVLNTGRPVVVSEFEKAADALLLTFSIGNQAVLDIVSGKVEPSGLLPMDMPVSMKAVEEQMEDVSHDYECYKDADGNIYKFAFGLNWQGVINDARVQKYQKK